MIGKEMLQLAQTFGFTKATIIDMEQVPFDHLFRKYCEENLCRQYNANYSCPLVCGSPEAMERRLRVYKKALVLQTIWNITDYHDHAAIHRAKASHNTAMLGLISNMRRGGHNGVMCGASCCTLCNTCEMAKGHLCVKPDQKFFACRLTVSMSENWRSNAEWSMIAKMESWLSLSCMLSSTKSDRQDT